MDERDVLADRLLVDARAVLELVQVLAAVHVHAQRDADELVHGARAADVRARGRGALLAAEVLLAEARERGEHALRDRLAELDNLVERCEARALCAEVDERRRGGGGDGAHAQGRVHGARGLERAADLARDEREERGEVGVREVGRVEARQLLAEDGVDLELELVLHRAEVERLAEDVEVACREQREHLERVDRRAGRDEGQRAAQMSILDCMSVRDSAYLTAWLCISADWMCVDTGLAR